MERNLLCVAPAFAVVVACAANAVPRGAWRSVLRALPAVAAAAGLVAVHVRSEEWTVYKPRPDWQSLAALAVREVASGRRVVLVFASPTNELLYYGPRMFPDWRGPADPRVMTRSGCVGPVAADVAPDVETFVVRNSFWKGCDDRLERAVEGSGRAMAPAARFRSLEVFGLVPR
jgi:hypothetical protein